MPTLPTLPEAAPSASAYPDFSVLPAHNLLSSFPDDGVMSCSLLCLSAQSLPWRGDWFSGWTIY